MWDKLQYIVFFSWAKVHAFLPMRVLYGFADILYLLIYKVAKYRVKIVRRNLKASFPERSDEELRTLEKRFYRHFSDYVLETVKLAHISRDELLRRAVVRNPEVVDRLVEEGHTCILLLMGHYGNWEWYTAAGHFFKKARLYQIYRPLANPAFDRLFVYLRTRFGASGIRKNDTVRDVIRLKQGQTPALVIFIADQTPSRANLHYWTDFLHQDTSFLTGAERIARKLDLPVVVLHDHCVRRGYYACELEVLTKHAKETPENWITEQYARLMEQTITADPAYWLWSHKRWKYKREDAIK